MIRLDPETQLLLACARRESVSRLSALLGRSNPDRLVVLAHRHGMLPMAHVVLRGLPFVDASLSAELERWYHRSLAGHLRAVADTAAASEALRQAGIVCVVAKGPVLAEVVYPEPDLRAYTDVDLFVHRADFAAAVETLEQSSCELLDRNWSMLRREVRGQLHLRGRFGTPVDLHWSLFNLAEVRGALAISIDELLDRRRQVNVADIAVETFDAEDTLLALALHASLGGGARISWLNDLAFAAARVEDWQAVVERARAWRAGPSVWAVLRRSARLVGAPVPQEVLAALAAPASWRLALDAAERLSPPVASVGRLTPSTLMTNATRHSTVCSTAALISKASRRRSEEARPDLERGDAADRAAYFEMVAAA